MGEKAELFNVFPGQVMAIEERITKRTRDFRECWWRGERDSNPRGGCPPSGLANRRTQPLCDLPVSAYGGGGGIRTHGTHCYVLRFSRPTH